MARTFVPDDYATPPLESDEQADSLGEQNHLALKRSATRWLSRFCWRDSAPSTSKDRDIQAFAGALTVQISCVNALEIIWVGMRSGRGIVLPQPDEATTDA